MAPNDAKQQIVCFKELQNHLTEFAHFNCDFNCALTDKEKKGGNSVSRKALVIKEIEHLASLYNLTDIWRDRNPHGESLTWRNKSSKIQCCLDFFLIFQNTRQRIAYSQARKQRGCTGCVRTLPQAPKVHSLILNVQTEGY